MVCGVFLRNVSNKTKGNWLRAQVEEALAGEEVEVLRVKRNRVKNQASVFINRTYKRKEQLVEIFQGLAQSDGSLLSAEPYEILKGLDPKAGFRKGTITEMLLQQLAGKSGMEFFEHCTRNNVFGNRDTLKTIVTASAKGAITEMDDPDAVIGLIRMLYVAQKSTEYLLVFHRVCDTIGTWTPITPEERHITNMVEEEKLEFDPTPMSFLWDKLGGNPHQNWDRDTIAGIISDLAFAILDPLHGSDKDKVPVLLRFADDRVTEYVGEWGQWAGMQRMPAWIQEAKAAKANTDKDAINVPDDTDYHEALNHLFADDDSYVHYEDA